MTTVNETNKQNFKSVHCVSVLYIWCLRVFLCPGDDDAPSSV